MCVEGMRRVQDGLGCGARLLGQPSPVLHTEQQKTVGSPSRGGTPRRACAVSGSRKGPLLSQLPGACASDPPLRTWLSRCVSVCAAAFPPFVRTPVYCLYDFIFAKVPVSK